MSKRVVGEIVVEPAGDWTVSLEGLLRDADRTPPPPGIRILTTRRFARSEDNKEKTLGFQFRVQELGGEVVSDKKFEEDVFKEQSDGFLKSRALACNHVIAGARKALRTKDHELGQSLCRLKDLILSEAKLEVQRQKGKKQVRYTHMSGADLSLCLDVLQQHFASVFENASILFRFRTDIQDDVTVEWTCGKTSDGSDRAVLGLAQKASGEKGEILRDLLLFAPDFIVTFNQRRWEKMTEAGRRALAYHELCHCCYDAEKDSTFIATHDIEEFEAVVEEFGPSGLTNDGRSFVEATYRAAITLDQIDLFENIKVKALLSEADTVTTRIRRGQAST